jgi:rod shape-determining protein MreC
MKRKALSMMILMTVLLFVSFFVDSYYKFGVLKRITSFFRPFAIVSAEMGTKLTSGLGNVSSIGNLQNENKELKSKLNDAIQEIAKLSEAQKENISLKNELGFKSGSSFSLQPAQVLSFDPNNVRDTILLDEGSNDGIKQGQVVLSEGFLVGKVTSVYPTTCKISIISDPLSAIPATISSSSTTGILKGRIGSGLILEQVPQSEKVSAGDVVVTSGLGGDYPKGLIIGKVDEIQKISGSIFQSITVRPMINLNELERVMIIK